MLLDPVFRRLLRPAARRPRALPEGMARRAEDLTIPGPTMPMKAWLVRSGERARGLAVFVHGWSSDGGRMAALAAPLLDAGIACLLLDLPGHGRTGTTELYHLARMAGDLRSVADLLARRDDLGGVPRALLGYSFGGLGAIHAVVHDPRWAALVVMATPIGPMQAMEIHLQGRGLPARWLRRPLRGAARRLVGVDPDTFDGVRQLPSLRVPALFVHGTEDEVVPADHAAALHAAAPAGGAELLLVAGAGHDGLLTDPAAGARVAAFLTRALR
jgi:pimeloyl-ACP methyl ester carboxylesterase